MSHQEFNTGFFLFFIHSLLYSILALSTFLFLSSSFFETVTFPLYSPVFALQTRSAVSSPRERMKLLKSLYL